MPAKETERRGLAEEVACHDAEDSAREGDGGGRREGRIGGGDSGHGWCFMV